VTSVLLGSRCVHPHFASSGSYANHQSNLVKIMEIACAEKNGPTLTDYLISTTGRQSGYGSESIYKTVCGLTQNEMETVRMGTMVYFRADRGSLGGTKGTFWRKVLFLKGGKGTFAPRVPSQTEVEMLRKKTGLQ
jgi:hypothetical protein